MNTRIQDNSIQHTDNNSVSLDKIEINNSSESSSEENTNIANISVFSILSGNIVNTNTCNKITDFTLIIFSFGGFTFGIISWFIIDNITAIGYILSAIFSFISFLTIRRIRLRAALEKSVNVLKKENDELKENNEELKENIDDLEDNNEELKENINDLQTVRNKLNEDLISLKETIGVFGDNSDEIINNLTNVYNNLKSQNEIHANINKNTVYLHILNVIKHYDVNSDFVLSQDELENAKETLLMSFPNLNYEQLKAKISNNKITAANIADSITLL